MSLLQLSTHHLTHLAKFLGPEQARVELRWMIQALQQSDDLSQAQTLSAMVARRASGEPLQYILGR